MHDVFQRSRLPCVQPANTSLRSSCSCHNHLAHSLGGNCQFSFSRFFSLDFLSFSCFSSRHLVCVLKNEKRKHILSGRSDVPGVCRPPPTLPPRQEAKKRSRGCSPAGRSGASPSSPRPGPASRSCRCCAARDRANFTGLVFGCIEAKFCK